MTTRQAMLKAFKIVGKSPLAHGLGISYQSMDRWVLTNKMPATEYNGKTQYSLNIARMTDDEVTVEDLCGWLPVTQTHKWDMAKGRPRS